MPHPFILKDFRILVSAGIPEAIPQRCWGMTDSMTSPLFCLCGQLDCSIFPHVSRKNIWIWAWHIPLIIALRRQKHAEVSLVCTVHSRQVWAAEWDPVSKQNRTVWKKSVHDIQTSPQHLLHHLRHLTVIYKALEDDWPGCMVRRAGAQTPENRGLHWLMLVCGVNGKKRIYWAKPLCYVLKPLTSQNPRIKW